MTTVLVVEDEHNIATVVRIALERDGHRVVLVRTGEEALAELPRHPIGLVVLDLGLPGMDGLEVCRRIRAGSSLPIIMLTARDEEADRVVGLELGADDYVPKPFSPRELAARVKAVLRRSSASPRADAVAVGDVSLSRSRHEVRVGDRPVRSARPSSTCSPSSWRTPVSSSRARVLLERVWGLEFPGGTRTVDQHVAQVRAKLGPARGSSRRSAAPATRWCRDDHHPHHHPDRRHDRDRRAVVRRHPWLPARLPSRAARGRSRPPAAAYDALPYRPRHAARALLHRDRDRGPAAAARGPLPGQRGSREAGPGHVQRESQDRHPRLRDHPRGPAGRHRGQQRRGRRRRVPRSADDRCGTSGRRRRPAQGERLGRGTRPRLRQPGLALRGLAHVGHARHGLRVRPDAMVLGSGRVPLPVAVRGGRALAVRRGRGVVPQPPHREAGAAGRRGERGAGRRGDADGHPHQGAARAVRHGAVVQPHGPQAEEGAGHGARLPDVGGPRAQDAADGDRRVRRAASGWGGRAPERRPRS